MEKIYKSYNKDEINHFRGLDELEIYFTDNMYETWELYHNETWEFIAEYKNRKNKPDIFLFDFNTHINHSNNPDTKIIHNGIKFDLWYAPVPNKQNYEYGYWLIFVENNESFKWMTILFANINDKWATESKNKIVIHGKMFAVYWREYIYYIVQNLFNNKLMDRCKRFDITLDIAKSKKEILTKEQFKTYTKEELEVMTRKEVKLCCSAMLWLWESMTFWTYKSRYSWLRIYDKIIEVQKNLTTSLYDWIENFNNLNRFEIEFWDKVAYRYKWDEILWNKNNILEKLFNSEIKTFIPQIADIKYSEYQKRCSIDDWKFNIYQLNDKSIAQTRWRINTILKNAGHNWLCEILFDKMNHNEKDELITYMINYLYKNTAVKDKYKNQINKNKNNIKCKNKLIRLKKKNETLYSDIDEIILLIEEYLYNPETYKKTLSLLSLVLNKLKSGG